MRIDAIKLAWLEPSNAFCPVAISNISVPSAKMSVRASASLPSSCSGAMYWKVPRSVPSAVSLLLIERQRRRRHRRDWFDDGAPDEAEIEQLRTRRCEHDVARLQVAVNEALAVGVIERIGDLRSICQQFLRRQRSAGEAIVQRFTFQVLHDEEGNPVLLANIEQRTDVRMMERRDCAHFGFESVAPIQPMNEVLQQHLDGDGRDPNGCLAPCRPRPSRRRQSARGFRTGRAWRQRTTSSQLRGGRENPGNSQSSPKTPSHGAVDITPQPAALLPNTGALPFEPGLGIHARTEAFVSREIAPRTGAGAKERQPCDDDSSLRSRCA